MGKTVVLGATGTLGLPICRYLSEQGYEVVAVGHSMRGDAFFGNLGMKYTYVDIADATSFERLPNTDVDCVIDFAGCLPAMMKKEDNNVLYSDTIVRGTINVLEHMRSVGCRKIIFPQSVYDLHYLFGTPVPISADAKRVNPLEGDHSIYVICKNAAVDIIHYYQKEYGIQGIILRLPGIFQYHPKPYILINGKKRIKLERVMIDKACRGEPLEIWGDSERILESVCVEDFLQIVHKCVDSKIASGIYNVGNTGATLEERVRAIREVFCEKGNESDIVYYPERADCTQYVLDIEKTKRELGYSPGYTWKDYLIQLKWHMDNQPNKELWGSFEDYYGMLRSIKTDADRYDK